MADRTTVVNHPSLTTTNLELHQATQLTAAGQFIEADKIFQKLLAQNTTDPMLLTLMANNFSAGERFSMAALFYERALELGVPDVMYGKTLGNLGFNYHRLERNAEARLTIQRAFDWLEANVDKIDMDDSRAITAAHMACTYINRGDPHTGLEWMERAFGFNPPMEFIDTMLWNKSLLLLEAGMFPEGWECYEAALKYGARKDRPYRFGEDTPFWDGKRAAHAAATLVIYGEQGIGDEAMFSTMFSEAAERWGGNVIIDATPRLVPVFARSFPTMEIYGSLEATLPDWYASRYVDAKIPMGSLGKFFRRTLDDFDAGRHRQLAHQSHGNRHTLAVNQAHQIRLLRKLDVLPHEVNVGISWRGGTMLTNRADRSIGLPALDPLLKHFPVNWISLQHGTDAGNEAASHGVHHWHSDLEDIDAHLALMSCCDLVITVCGTPAHFAGAIGKECWVMAPNAIRWCYGLEGETMPWYDSVRMFRQKTPGDWKSVIQGIGDELGNYLRGLPGTERSAASAAE